MGRPPAVTINEFALRAFREKCGLSQQELALRAGISPSYYSEIEGGVANPSRHVLGRFADALVVNQLALERFVRPSEERTSSETAA